MPKWKIILFWIEDIVLSFWDRFFPPPEDNDGRFEEEESGQTPTQEDESI